MLAMAEVISSRAPTPVLLLGGFPSNEALIQIRNIEGVGPVKSTIVSTSDASLRGELYQASVLEKRNIVLTLGLNPDWEDNSFESLRHRLYRYFMTGQWVKLRFYSSVDADIGDHLPPVEIEGYVESNEPNVFSKEPEMQISVVCPKPDFVAAEATVVVHPVSSRVVDVIENEYTVPYIGTAPTGFELKVESTGDNIAYTGPLFVTNKTPDIQELEVAATIDASLRFEMNSIRGSKFVRSIETGVDPEITNLLPTMSDDSVWPQLIPEDVDHTAINLFSVSADEEGQEWTLTYFARFGGL